MINSIEIINDLNYSLFLELTKPEETGILVKKITGLEPIKSEISYNKIPLMDGSHFTNIRTNERSINITLKPLGYPNDVEYNRIKIYKVTLVKHKCTLYINTDYKKYKIDGYFEDFDVDIFSSEETVGFTIKCPNPYFQDLSLQTNTLYGITPMFEFPFENLSLTENLIEFGNIENETEQTVWYDGDINTGFICYAKFNNPTTYLTIHKSLERKFMRININTKHGDTIIINTIKGQKSIILIRDLVQINILNSLSYDSKWLEISKGDNFFIFESDDKENGVELYFENPILYQGV